MASFDAHKKETTKLLQLVSFLIGREEFGVDIGYVQEINRMDKLQKYQMPPILLTE